jgi:hypothetical protein
MWGYFQPLSRGSATGGEQPNVGRTFNLDDIVVDPELGRQIEGIYFDGSVPTKRFKFPSQTIWLRFKAL